MKWMRFAFLFAIVAVPIFAQSGGGDPLSTALAKVAAVFALLGGSLATILIIFHCVSSFIAGQRGQALVELIAVVPGVWLITHAQVVGNWIATSL